MTLDIKGSPEKFKARNFAVLRNPGCAWRHLSCGNVSTSQYEDLEFRDPLGIDVYVNMGGARSVAAGFSAELWSPGQPPCQGIIHLWSLETLPEDESSTAPVRAAQEFGCESVMHLVQAISRADSGATPRLWLVTRGSQAVSGP